MEPPPEYPTFEAMKRRIFAAALERHGTIQRAAAALGIPRATFYRWVKRYELAHWRPYRSSEEPDPHESQQNGGPSQ